MTHRKAILKYFFDINMFNIPFSLVFAFTSGIVWSIVVFASFGIVVGLIDYKTFKNNEYYGYYNLGFTKVDLIKRVLFLNVILSLPLFLIFILFK